MALVATLVLVLTGCDAVTSTAAKYNPFTSFASRCERLPPSRIEIRQEAIRVATNNELSQRELTRLGEDNPTMHRTLGLTRTEFRQDAQIEIQGLSDSGGGRSCARPHIVLELAMTPMNVYVARELADNACGHAAVFEHEMKHVAAFREHLAETARALEVELPQLFGQRIILAPDATAAEAQVRQTLQAFLSEFTARNTVQMKQRQMAVDSADEYARVNDACGGLSIEWAGSALERAHCPTDGRSGILCASRKQ